MDDQTFSAQLSSLTEDQMIELIGQSIDIIDYGNLYDSLIPGKEPIIKELIVGYYGTDNSILWRSYASMVLSYIAKLYLKNEPKTIKIKGRLLDE